MTPGAGGGEGTWEEQGSPSLRNGPVAGEDRHLLHLVPAGRALALIVELKGHPSSTGPWMFTQKVKEDCPEILKIKLCKNMNRKQDPVCETVFHVGP